MKEINWDEVDRDIHRRLRGAMDPCPRYSREPEVARTVVDRVNSSGHYRVIVKRVVGEDGDGETDWQCEVFTADGLDNLATEIDGIEAVAICRAISGADVVLG